MEDAAADSKIMPHNDVRYLEYYDRTKDNQVDLIDKGVEIICIEGHMESVVKNRFDRCEPYKRLDMFVYNGVFTIIYDEEEDGGAIDRFISIKGRIEVESKKKIKSVY